MDLLTLALFIPACFALNLALGPNNLLSMSNAKQYGFKVTCFAGIGRLIAFVAMITLAASGLASVLYASEKLFFAIKVLGACYLFWLAYQLLVANTAKAIDYSSANKSILALAKQEFLLAIGNPKAILILTSVCKLYT